VEQVPVLRTRARLAVLLLLLEALDLEAVEQGSAVVS
jgi:hypothetical protein